MSTDATQLRGIACAGNFILDRVHTLAAWPRQGNLTHILSQQAGIGGGAANVVCDLASMGFPAPLLALGSVGDDLDGGFVRTSLEKAGVDASGLVTIAGQATAHTHVMNVPGETRTFFYHGGANDHFDDHSIDPVEVAARGFRLFYLGYLMLLPGLDRLGPDGRTGASRLLEKAAHAGLITLVDFVSSEAQDFAAVVSSSLPFCDYLVINEIEAGRATGLEPRDADGRLIEENVLKAAGRLLGEGVRRGIIIHAPELSLWLAPDEAPLVTRPDPVAADQIVSTVGAGDAFCAAVLYGLHEGWPKERVARLAHRAARYCLVGATATDNIPSMNVLLSECPA